MLGMVDVEFIKLRVRDGWSIRETARRTGWSRQAIRKALAAPARPRGASTTASPASTASAAPRSRCARPDFRR